MNRLYSFFLISSLVLVYMVIAAGATVRMTGSGMGCPDWPKCFGYLIPPTEQSQLDWKAKHQYKKGQVIIINESLQVAPKDFESNNYYNFENWEPYTMHDYAIFNPTHTWIEFLNRLLGAVAGLATLFLFITSIFRSDRDKLSTTISFLIILGMGFQAWLGKTVVDSNLLPSKITIHMGMAFLILVFLVFLLEQKNTFVKKLPRSITFNSFVAVSLVLTIIQISIGTQVRQFIDGQIHYWGLESPTKWLIEAPFLFYFHRSFSLLVLFVNLTIGYILFRHQYIPLFFLGILLLIGLEILSGIWMYYFDFPFSSQPLHLLLASLLFGAQTYFMIRIIKQK